MAIQTYEQTFPVSGQVVFKLSNIAGKVSLHQGEEPVILVKAALDDASGSAERTKIEMRQEENGRVVVETRFSDPIFGIFNRAQPCKVDYDVTLPAGGDLQVSTVSAAQELHGLQGKFQLSTISGNIHLVSLQGDLQISTISGNVYTTDLQTGKLNLSAVSGDIDVAGSVSGTVEANTVSGQIHLDAPLGTGPYSFRSVSGDVSWKMPAAAPFTLELHTVSGDLSVNLPVTQYQAERGTRVWRVQGGGTAVRLNSVSGNLQVSAPQAPAESDKTVSGLSRKEILDKIEAGEMTAEEALAALSA